MLKRNILSGIVVLGTLTADIADKAYLASRGVSVALQGHQPIMAAAEAVRKTMQALRDGVPPSPKMRVRAPRRVTLT